MRFAQIRTVNDRMRDTEEPPEPKYPKDERWTRITCNNGHDEKLEELTRDVPWFCPKCGERRQVETNNIQPEFIKSDKI